MNNYINFLESVILSLLSERGDSDLPCVVNEGITYSPYNIKNFISSKRIKPADIAELTDRVLSGGGTILEMQICLDYLEEIYEYCLCRTTGGVFCCTALLVSDIRLLKERINATPVESGLQS